MSRRSNPRPRRAGPPCTGCRKGRTAPPRPGARSGAPAGQVLVKLLLHPGAVTPEDLAADAAGEVQPGVRRADQQVGRLVEDVALLDAPPHGDTLLRPL